MAWLVAGRTSTALRYLFGYKDRLKYASNMIAATSGDWHSSLPPGAAFEEIKSIARSRLSKMMDEVDALTVMVSAETLEELPPYVLSSVLFRTQKTLGLTQYRNFSSPIGFVQGVPFVVLPFSVPSSESSFPFFARPAPTRPRHGFVESRVVNNPMELLQVYKETLAEDPEGEVICMKTLTGAYSAVATNAGVTWGFGNDGVTGGSGGVTIPTPTPVDIWNNRLTNHSTHHFGIENSAYVEIVQDVREVTSPQGNEKIPQEVTTVVQVRDGPEQSVAKNFIPRKMKVKQVIGSTYLPESLLAWEKKLKGIANKNGTKDGLVVHLNGHSLSSHYAVHAIELGIPVVTDPYSPKIGQILKPEAEARAIEPLTKAETKLISRLMGVWNKKDHITAYNLLAAKAAIATSVAVVHSMSQWGNEKHLLRLRAFAMDTLLRFLASAVLGELRHWNEAGPGRGKMGSVKRRTQIVSTTRYDFQRPSRNYIYENSLKGMTYDKTLEKMNDAIIDFRTAGWSGGFGGGAWVTVARVTARMAKKLIAFQKAPTPARWGELAISANLALHTVHNNGAAVNKWIGGGDLGNIASAPALGFMNHYAGRLVLGLPIVRPAMTEVPQPEDEVETVPEIREDD